MCVYLQLHSNIGSSCRVSSSLLIFSGTSAASSPSPSLQTHSYVHKEEIGGFCSSFFVFFLKKKKFPQPLRGITSGGLKSGTSIGPASVPPTLLLEVLKSNLPSVAIFLVEFICQLQVLHAEHVSKKRYKEALTGTTWLMFKY